MTAIDSLISKSSSTSFEHSLFCRADWSYLFRRVKGPVTTSLGVWILHLLKLSALSGFYSISDVATIFILEQVSMVFVTGWWGFLDLQRIQLRSAAKTDRQTVIESWRRISTLFGLILVPVVFFSLKVLGLIDWPSLNIPNLTGWIILSRLFLDLQNAQIASFVNSFRRVYFSTWWILALELSHLISLFVFLKLLGPWGLFWSTLLSTGINHWVHRRALLRAFQISRLPMNGLRFRLRPKVPILEIIPSWKAALTSSLLSLGIKLPMLLLVGISSLASEDFFTLIINLLPLIALAPALGRSYYIDVRKYAMDPWQGILGLWFKRMYPISLIYGASIGLCCFFFAKFLGLNAWPLIPILALTSFSSLFFLNRLTQIQSSMALSLQKMSPFWSVESQSLFEHIVAARKEPLSLFTLTISKGKKNMNLVRTLLAELLMGQGIILSIGTNRLIWADWRSRLHNHLSEREWVQLLQGYVYELRKIGSCQNGEEALQKLSLMIPIAELAVDSKLVVNLNSFLAQAKTCGLNPMSLQSKIIHGKTFLLADEKLQPYFQDGSLVGFRSEVDRSN